MEINWYPGHMYKTLGDLKKLVKVIDFGMIILDARIPKTSLKDDLLAIFMEKPLLVLFNKCDLADQNKLSATITNLKNKGIYSLKINAQNGLNITKIRDMVETFILKEKITKASQKGINLKPYKTMIVGIPNSGKSSLVNRLTKQKKVIVKYIPGTTKNISWLNAGDFLILDTPGLLWPKLSNDEQLYLAYTGAIPKHIIVPEELSYNLVGYLISNYSDEFFDYYKIERTNDINEIFIQIAKKSGFLLKQGAIDYHRLGNKILNDYTLNKFGGISFETN